MFFRHVPCFLMCILFYFTLFWLHAYAFAIHSMVHCGSAFEPGAVRLPYYCTSICVRSCCTWRASCVDSKTKQNCTKLIYARTRIRRVYVPYMACISARRVYLPSLLQTWQGLAKTDTAAWVSHDMEHRHKLLKKLVSECGLGLDTLGTDDDKKIMDCLGRNKLARAGMHSDGSNTTMCTVETFSGRWTSRGNG